MMQANSNQRIIDLVLWLLSGATVTFETWTARYGSGKTRRTFQRDMQYIATALNDAHYEQQLARTIDRQQADAAQAAYRLSGDASATKLTKAITAAQIILGSQALSQDESNRVLDYLAVPLNPSETHDFKAAISMAKQSYLAVADERSILQRLAQVTAAIAAHQILTFDYRERHQPKGYKQQQAQPEVLFFDHGHFYVVMQVAKRKGLFRLDQIVRFTAVAPGNAHLSSPHYSLQDYRRQTHLLATGELITFRFKCRIDPETALAAFPNAKRISASTAAEVVIEARSYEAGAILWLLSQGPNVEVLAPPALITKLKAELVAAAQQYER